MANPVVAIVGRPNVGKSTVFNRIAGERISIVEDTPGVTRDRIYARSEWMGQAFNLIDTGGIDIGDEPFVTQITEQAEIAIDEADVIVFVTSVKEGVTDADEKVARILYKTDKPVILAVNKVDNPEVRSEIYDFYSLGFGDPVPISGTHGISPSIRSRSYHQRSPNLTGTLQFKNYFGYLHSCHAIQEAGSSPEICQLY